MHVEEQLGVSGGAFLLNHSNDPMTDTSAKNSLEFEWAHEFRPCDNDSGRLATHSGHSHGMSGDLASLGTMSGPLFGYTCEFLCFPNEPGRW